MESSCRAGGAGTLWHPASCVTVAELLHGVERADSEKRRLKRSAFVEKIIQTLPVYSFDLNAARIYAKVWANLAKKGTTVSAHDLMIASTATALGPGSSPSGLPHRHHRRHDTLLPATPKPEPYAPTGERVHAAFFAVASRRWVHAQDGSRLRRGLPSGDTRSSPQGPQQHLPYTRL